MELTAVGVSVISGAGSWLVTATGIGSIVAPWGSFLSREKKENNPPDFSLGAGVAMGSAVTMVSDTLVASAAVGAATVGAATAGAEGAGGVASASAINASIVSG